MTLLPTGKLETWRKRAKSANKSILENLIEFKEFYDELKDRHGEMMQAYREAADANMMSEHTFRDKFGLVNRFRDSDLLYWFENGISFDHLDNAPSLRPDDPASLLDDCIENGNENGETMTVPEMVNFVLEGENKRRVKARYHFDRAFSKVWNLHNILKWTDEKAKSFKRELQDLIDKYVSMEDE